MKKLIIIATLSITSCTHYPELAGTVGNDQYGYSYTGRCLWRGFLCSVETSNAQKAHNAELRQQEKRLERAIRKSDN